MEARYEDNDTVTLVIPTTGFSGNTFPGGELLELNVTDVSTKYTFDVDADMGGSGDTSSDGATPTTKTEFDTTGEEFTTPEEELDTTGKELSVTTNLKEATTEKEEVTVMETMTTVQTNISTGKIGAFSADIKLQGLGTVAQLFLAACILMLQQLFQH